MGCAHLKPWLGALCTSWRWQPVANLLLGSEGPVGLAVQGWDCHPSGQLSSHPFWTHSHCLDGVSCFTCRFAQLGTTEAKWSPRP